MKIAKNSEQADEFMGKKQRTPGVFVRGDENRQAVSFSE